MGDELTMQTFEVISFLDPVPHGLDNYWLVKKDEFAQQAAPTYYDVHTDEVVPLTQEVVDGWQAAHNRVAKMIMALRAVVEQAKGEAKDITPGAVEEIMALIKAPD